MAGMEIFGWLSVLTAIIYRLTHKLSFATFGMSLSLLTFVVFGILSLVFNPPLKDFWPQAGFLRFAFLVVGLAWAVDSVWSEKFEKQLKTVWLSALALMGAYGVLQMLTGIDFIPRSRVVVDPIGSIWKATGFFNMSLTYGYSVGLSTLAIGLTAIRSYQLRRMAYIAAAFGVMGVIASTARGAWVGLFICLAIYILAERRKLILPFAGLSAAAIAVLFTFASHFGGKIEKLTHFQLDHSASVRFDLWPAYFAMFLDHPWFGVGLFQGDRLLSEYYERLNIVQPFVSHAHNNFVQILAGAGIFGFLAYCWMIAVPLKKAWDLRKVTAWGWPLLLAQIFLHIGGLTEANFIDGEVNHMLMFIWTLTLVLALRFGGVESRAKSQSA